VNKKSRSTKVEESLYLAREARRQPFIKTKLQRLHYRTLRALGFLTGRQPGVSLRSTPGFILSPATRVLEGNFALTCSEFLNYSQESEYGALLSTLDDIGPMLTGLSRHLQKKSR
jgi:hypothetical protein